MIRLKLNDKPRGGNRYAIVIGERVTRVLSNCYFHAIRLKGIRFEVETRSHEQMSQNNEIQYLSIFLDLLQPLSWWITRVRPDEHYPFIVSWKFLMLDVSRKYVISKKEKRKYGNFSRKISISLSISIQSCLFEFIQSTNSCKLNKFLYTLMDGIICTLVRLLNYIYLAFIIILLCRIPNPTRVNNSKSFTFFPSLYIRYIYTIFFVHFHIMLHFFFFLCNNINEL